MDDERRTLTRKQLATIERHLRSANDDISRNREETVDILRYARDVTALLAELEWRRAREAALVEVVECVAMAQRLDLVVTQGATTVAWVLAVATPSLIEQARALLAIDEQTTQDE